jgi:hypothetical protein
VVYVLPFLLFIKLGKNSISSNFRLVQYIYLHISDWFVIFYLFLLSDDTETSSENKHHVTFETSHRISSQGSDTTVTTIGSLQSIPSSISQSSPKRDTIVSPSSSSSSRQSVSEGTTSRMSGKRMSIDQVILKSFKLNALFIKTAF